MKIKIEVPALPPASSSPNSRSHWVKRYRDSKAYQQTVFYCCVDAKKEVITCSSTAERFPWRHARLKLTFVFPEHRRRDPDNLLARFKPGLDALVDAGLLLDDDVLHLTIEPVIIEVDRARAPLTIIEVASTSLSASLAKYCPVTYLLPD